MTSLVLMLGRWKSQSTVRVNCYAFDIGRHNAHTRTMCMYTAITISRTRISQSAMQKWMKTQFWLFTPKHESSMQFFQGVTALSSFSRSVKRLQFSSSSGKDPGQSLLFRFFFFFVWMQFYAGQSSQQILLYILRLMLPIGDINNNRCKHVHKGVLLKTTAGFSFSNICFLQFVEFFFTLWRCSALNALVQWSSIQFFSQVFQTKDFQNEEEIDKNKNLFFFHNQICMLVQQSLWADSKKVKLSHTFTEKGQILYIEIYTYNIPEAHINILTFWCVQQLSLSLDIFGWVKLLC